MRLPRSEVLSVLAALAVLTGIASADGPVVLRYRMKKGDQTPYRTQSALKQTQTVMNVKTENMLSQETVSIRTVDEIDPEGNALITVRTEHLHVKMQLG